MDYLLVKSVHQGAVALSAAGFLVRGVLSLAGSPLARSRTAKTLPHIVDSVLLLSALTLVGILSINIGVHPWLLAKLTGLLVYIGLGMVALRPSVSWRMRACAWLAAMATLGWIASVAITKSPLGFLGGLLL